MPDIYVMNDWISQALVVWLASVAITYGFAVLITRRRKP